MKADAQDLTSSSWLATDRIGSGHLIIVFAAMVVTVVAWQFSAGQVERRSWEHFDRSASQTLDVMVERMERYDEALRAGVAVLRMNNDEPSPQMWSVFAQNLRIEQRYPGIHGIGVILSVPSDDLRAFEMDQRRLRPDFTVNPITAADDHFVITMIEPLDQNRQAVGLDLTFEENRHRAMTQARDTSQSTISGPILLVQDETETPGFLLIEPYFAQTEDGGNGVFLGAVYAPFVVSRLMEGVLGQERRVSSIQIRDGGEIIYDEFHAGNPQYDDNPVHERQITLNMYGRTWEVLSQTNLAFRQVQNISQPTVILLCGLLIDLALFLLFVSLTKSNRRAKLLANDLMLELQTEKGELEASNAALERYAHISSHDLRTPLRAMRDMTDYLVEDLIESYPEIENDEQFSQNITQINFLIEKMELLIDGMLQYSLMGQDKSNIQVFETRAAVLRAFQLIDGQDHPFSVSGDFPMVHCDRGLFDIIVENLVRNAVQHHTGPKSPQVHVSVATKGTSVILKVQDDGPGINPRYHDRIFDMFQILNHSGSSMAAGLGLAFVKRAVTLIGGHVAVTSDDQQGSTFTVMLHGITADNGTERTAA